MALFKSTDQGHPPLNPFKMDASRIFDMIMGRLQPVYVHEVVAGDVWRLGVRHVIRMPPMVAPPLHEINVRYRAFFVPGRLIGYSDDPDDPDLNFIKFLSGGPAGNDNQVLPTWTWADLVAEGITTPELYYNCLLESMGIPWPANGTTVSWPDDAAPIRLPIRALNLVWNEYFRDENYWAPRSLDDLTPLPVAWEKDYLQSVLPWQQRGSDVSVPLSGVIPVDWETPRSGSQGASGGYYLTRHDNVFDGLIDAGKELRWVAPFDPSPIAQIQRQDGSDAAVNSRLVVPGGIFDGASVDLASGDPVMSVSDMRLAVQLQRMLERNARAGVRDTEWLRANWGVAPRDERLQRPEYIGGFQSPMVTSEVLQTAESVDAPVGEMYGHGISVDGTSLGRYRAVEPGYIIIVANLAPTPMYTRGHERFWTRRSRYDFYLPTLANLSEQPVLRSEVDAATTSGHPADETFGWQGRWDEYRYARSYVSGLFRPNDQLGDLAQSLDTWHLAREYAGGPMPAAAQSRVLDVLGTDADLYRIFAQQPTEEVIAPMAYAHVAVQATVYRPLPASAIPGRLDHIYGG